MKHFAVFLSVVFLCISCNSKDSEEPSNDVNQRTNTEDNQRTNTGAQANRGQGNTQTGRNPSGSSAQGGEQGGGGSNEFFIETTLISDFNDNYSIQKIGKILPNQSLDLSPQVSGDVSQVYIKQGDEVSIGQTLVVLKDSYSRYGLDVEKGQIDYDKQLITKESQIISIDKNIDDLNRNLEDAKRLYDNAVLSAQQDIKSAEIAFENSSTLDSSSSAYLNLEKAKIDYESLLVDNQQSLESFIRDIEKEYNNLLLNINDIIEFGDELFGVTQRSRDFGDDIDTYLGALDSLQKTDTKGLLLEMISYRDYLSELNYNSISEETALSFMATYKEGYSNVTEFLNSLEITINNSIPSLGTLSDNDIDGFISQINNYQGGNQGDLSSYNSTLKSISDFLATYKDSELSALKGLELTLKGFENSEENAGISYEKTLITIDNTLSAALKNYESLQASYDVALSERQVTIRSLDNSIASAKNTLTKAQVEYGKLTIRSPISGIISSLDVDIGEYVSNGNNIASLISNNATQIDVSLSEQEVESITLGDTVKVIYGDNEYSGSIFSIGGLADEALNYSVTTTLNENIGLIGGSAKVLFEDASSQGVSIPFSIVSVIGDDRGTINIFKDGKLETIEVDLGSITGSNIEILGDIPSDVSVISSSLENYNPKTQQLAVEKK